MKDVSTAPFHTLATHLWKLQGITIEEKMDREKQKAKSNLQIRLIQAKCFLFFENRNKNNWNARENVTKRVKRQNKNEILNQMQMISEAGENNDSR